MSNPPPNVEEACTVTQVRLYSKVYNDLKKIADSHEISVEQLISDTILDYLYPKKSDSSDNSDNQDTLPVKLNLSKNYYDVGFNVIIGATGDHDLDINVFLAKIKKLTGEETGEE